MADSRRYSDWSERHCDPAHRRRRAGISLMEVLISIGVIALGIFGVAALIPVAQFKVAEGTTNDRVASLGPSAAAQFRVQGMDDPNNWLVEGPTSEYTTPYSELRNQNDWLRRRAYCIDPLWFAEGGYLTASGGEPMHQMHTFPITAPDRSFVGMPRLGLRNLQTGNRAAEAALARKIFNLADEVVFDRPSDQSQQPRRQYFRDSSNHATAAVTNATLSWFATLSPSAFGNSDHPNSDDYILSIVVVKDRLPLLAFTEDAVAAAASTEEKVTFAGSQHAGEIWLQQYDVASDEDLSVADLKTGDWILLGLPHPATASGKPKSAIPRPIYRWTQIIGASEESYVPLPNGQMGRFFTVSNDDFFRPGEMAGTAILARGVKSVVERTIRLDKRRRG